MTDVAFVVQPDDSILAVFPSLPGTNDFDADCTCYQRVGQHGHCDIAYIVDECKQADYTQYADLLDELKRIGYDDLYVIRKDRIDHDAYTEERWSSVGL